MSLHPHPTYYSQHECPTCSGWMTACIDPRCEHLADHVRAKLRKITGETTQTPSTAPAHQRVTWHGPLAVEQDVGDTDWTVTVHLTDDARRQVLRDLYPHRALLLAYFRMRQQANDRALHDDDRAEAREHADALERRIAGDLQSMATTQWTLTPQQAEDLTQQLEDAQADPDECAVGTCTAYAIDGGSYCGPHEDGV